MSETYQSVPGTFIRGADGALYFVPDSELESYRVPEFGPARDGGVSGRPSAPRTWGAGPSTQPGGDPSPRPRPHGGPGVAGMHQ